MKQIETAVEKLQNNIEFQNKYIIDQARKITKEYLNSYKDDFQEKLHGE